MQLVNLVSMCLLLKAPYCQRLKLSPCFYLVSREEAFHTFSHTHALPAAVFCSESQVSPSPVSITLATSTVCPWGTYLGSMGT